MVYINDSDLSRKAAENFRRYEDLWCQKIQRDANQLARDMERRGLEEGIAYKDSSGGVQWR